LASASISAVSAFSSLGLHLLRLPHGPLDLRPHVGHPDHDQARLPGVKVLAQLLEVMAAHARRA
jgi:hypothetical protein